MISTPQLIRQRFKFFYPDIGHRNAAEHWQKYVGVYYVNLYRYAESEFSNGERKPESWMLEININDPHLTFQAHDVKTIDKALRLAERFYNSMVWSPNSELARR